MFFFFFSSLFLCRDGPDQSSPQIGQFSGNTALESVYSTSNIILIKFHSDFSGAGFFVLSYHGKRVTTLSMLLQGCRSYKCTVLTNWELYCVCSDKNVSPMNSCLCFVILSYNSWTIMLSLAVTAETASICLLCSSLSIFILITIRSDLFPHFDSRSLSSARIFSLWLQHLCHGLPLLTVGLLIVFTLWIGLGLFAERLSSEVLTSTFQSFYQYDFTSKWTGACLNAVYWCQMYIHFQW